MWVYTGFTFGCLMRAAELTPYLLTLGNTHVENC
jgi:hypothetical protein